MEAIIRQLFSTHESRELKTMRRMPSTCSLTAGVSYITYESHAFRLLLYQVMESTQDIMKQVYGARMSVNPDFQVNLATARQQPASDVMVDGSWAGLGRRGACLVQRAEEK